MELSMRAKTFISVATGMVAGAALTLATVATPAAPAAAQMDALAVAQKAQAIATIYQLDKSDFHDMDVAIAGGSIPAGALGAVRRARIANQATSWPHAMEEDAKALTAKMMEFEEALRAEDVAKSGPLAKEVHDVEHDFSTRVYAWLGGEQAPAHGH